VSNLVGKWEGPVHAVKVTGRALKLQYLLLQLHTITSRPFSVIDYLLFAFGALVCNGKHSMLATWQRKCKCDLIQNNDSKF
jgi:hypothetical protein